MKEGRRNQKNGIRKAHHPFVQNGHEYQYEGKFTTREVLTLNGNSSSQLLSPRSGYASQWRQVVLCSVLGHS